MILDKELLFDDGVAAVATTSAHVVDLGVGRDLGVGENLYLKVANVEPTGADIAADLTFTIEQADDEAFATNLEDAQISGVMTVGQSLFAARIQPFGVSRRYIRIKYSAGGDFLKTCIVKDIQATRAYKSGYTIG